eukprot:CAMPEP_0117444840 /NCGR_PEP_ID=MMETSP0759-20121206/5466_1 /TAXON_ID=63605 /ORGANISM="Percolomonas cosmopolitus, Strain WS" /LENGTH=215 /DNA_ID=CAMNT_0005236955 /DNA_START=252 /DNA_END=899 /DNA_ORIENTATION=-
MLSSSTSPILNNISHDASEKSKSSASIIGCCGFVSTLIFLGLEIYVYAQGTDTTQKMEQCNTTMLQSLMLCIVVSSALAFVSHILTILSGAFEMVLRSRIRKDEGGLIVSGCLSFTFQFFGKLMDLLSFILIVVVSIMWLSSSCDTATKLYSPMRFFLIAYWAYFAMLMAIVLCLLCCTCCVVGGFIGFAAFLGIMDTAGGDEAHGERLLSGERV